MAQINETKPHAAFRGLRAEEGNTKAPFPVLDVKAGIEAENGRYAQQVRSILRENKTLLVNLMASPGAGKTTLLSRTVDALIKDGVRVGVMEADVDADVDARTLQSHGAAVVQLHTGGSCHMDARMTLEGLAQLPLAELDIVFLENVGNLVCPAEFDVGADARVMILSVPEGDDKPLKYPLMFQVSDVLLVNKTDTMPVFDFDADRLRSNIEALHPQMPVIPLSAKTGEGMDEWLRWLKQEVLHEGD